jgi:hypothetical protein
MGDDDQEPTPTDEGTEPAELALSEGQKSYLSALRKEAGKYRIRARTAETKLAALQNADSQIRDLKINNALLRRGNVDPDLVEFRLKKENLWADLDPADDDFAELLNDRVDDLAARHPDVTGNRPAATSGGGASGDTRGKGDDGGPMWLTPADAKAMTPEQAHDAYKRGKFDRALGRR